MQIGPKPRRKTPTVWVGPVPIGGDHPVVVQSMTNTDTADVEATANQVIELARAGSEIVRITVNHEEAAAAVPEEFIDAVSLLGPTERIAQRLAEFAAAGVTTLAVTPFASDLEAKLAALEAVAKAVARADLLDEA